MKGSLISLVVLGLGAVLANVLDFNHGLRFLFLEITLIWIVGVTYANNADAPYKTDIGIGANIALFLGGSEYRVSKIAIVNQVLIYFVILSLVLGYGTGIIRTQFMLLELWRYIFSTFLFLYSLGAFAIIVNDAMK